MSGNKVVCIIHRPVPRAISFFFAVNRTEFPSLRGGDLVPGSDLLYMLLYSGGGDWSISEPVTAGLRIRITVGDSFLLF